jgi:hypothetical protein
MAAYECRGPSAREVYFEGNTCIDAGGGFAMQGEPLPRNSEIYPQPMGHHVFIWRMENVDGKCGIPVYIRNNIFQRAMYGAAIYSIIDLELEKQFVIDNNRYQQEEGSLLMKMNGQLYLTSQFGRYQQESGHDRNSGLEVLPLEYA